MIKAESQLSDVMIVPLPGKMVAAPLDHLKFKMEKSYMKANGCRQTVLLDKLIITDHLVALLQIGQVTKVTQWVIEVNHWQIA